MRREPKTNPGMKTRIGARPYRITTALGRDSKLPSEAFGSGQAPEASGIDSPAAAELESSIAGGAGDEFEKTGLSRADQNYQRRIHRLNEKLKPGDILLMTRGLDLPGGSLTSRAAATVGERVAERFGGEFHHTGIYVGGGKLVDARPRDGIQLRDVEEDLGNASIRVLRPDVTQKAKRIAIKKIKKKIGDSYSLLQPAKVWTGKVLGQVGDKRRAVKENICTNAIADAYRGSVDFGKEPSLVGPWDIRASDRLKEIATMSGKGQPFLPLRSHTQRHSGLKKESAVEAFLSLDKTGGAKLPKYLYHGSPGDFDKLENRGGGVHLTVAPGLASAFVIPRDDIAKGRSGKIRPAQSIWNKPLKELRQPIKHHEVSVLPSRGAKNPVVPGETGKSSGFVYKIETRKIVDQLHVNPPEPREIIFTGDSIPIKTKVPVEVEWATKRDPKLRGGAGVNTFARSLLKEAACQAPELSQIDSPATNEFESALAGDASNEFEKEAAASALRADLGEFAPGIPGERGIHNIPKVRPRADNPEWTASLSMHPAARRGDHHDLRLIDPKGRAHSWAFQDMPKPGKSTYATQTPTHKKRYALRTEPYTIPEGYGATRPGAQVEPKFVSPVEVVEAGNDKIRFLKHEGQRTQEFVARRLVKAIGSVKPLWALHNATKNRSTAEGKKIPSYKPKYNEIAPESINLADSDQVMSPKLDGSHVLVDLPGTGDKFARVYSYRPTARETGLIEHTFKFPDFQKRRGSEATKNTMIRAECWGTGKDGKAIPAEQLGGLLNAGVLKSRQKQKEMGIKLRLTGFDVVRHNGRNMENKPFAEKLKVLNRVQKATKGFVEAPEVALTAEHKKSMLEGIQNRSRKDTEEGVVLHSLSKALPPTKAKFKPDVDVYVRQVFDKPKGKAKGHAGGFGYAFTPDGPVIGRVGTGFDHATRKDMLENPDRYVGRVAKVKSVRNSENRTDPTQLTKALRAPSFQGWHLDKTDPRLMEGDANLLEKKAVVEQLREGWQRLQEKAHPEGIIDETMARSRKLRRLKPFIRGATDLADAAEVPQSGVQSWIRKRLGTDA